MKLQPLNDRIVVEAAAKEETTIGGIILPDSAQEKPLKGTVLAVGPGKLGDSGKRTPVDIKVGETVLYAKYSGTEVTVGGKDYIILRQEDVLAIVTGQSNLPKKAVVTKTTTSKTATKAAKTIKKSSGKKTLAGTGKGKK